MSNYPEINEKVLKYESFVNDTLREDLRKITEERDKIYAKTAEYLQLKNTILGIKDAHMSEMPLKTKMDIGCNFYVNAIVPDPSHIFVNIGLDVYIDFTMDEAIEFINKKVAYFETSASLLTTQSTSVKAKIKMILEGLKELQMLDQLS